MTSFDDRRVSIGFFDKGAGEPVILLHSSSSSSRQWLNLVEEIGDRYRLLGLDLYGYGDTDFPRSVERFGLDQEVSLVERLIDRLDGPFHLVGHSYGGAVAMKTALEHRDRVRSLYVHEPVAFSLLELTGHIDEWNEIRTLGGGIAAHVNQGRHEEATELFIDYWSGKGTWTSLPNRRKPDFTRTIRKVVLDFDALLADTDELAVYAQLSTPTRITAGNTGPRPARRVAELLGTAFGTESLHVIDGVGHMAPVTHPQKINPHIISHLEANPLS